MMGDMTNTVKRMDTPSRKAFAAAAAAAAAAGQPPPDAGVAPPMPAE